MLEGTERGTDPIRSSVEIFWIGGKIGGVRIEVVHPVYRNNMEMGVRHLETGNHQRNPLRFEPEIEGEPDLLRDRHQMVGKLRVEVDPMVDLLARHHQRVPRRQRANGQKRHTQLVLPDKPPR